MGVGYQKDRRAPPLFPKSLVEQLSNSVQVTTTLTDKVSYRSIYIPITLQNCDKNVYNLLESLDNQGTVVV